MVDLLDNGIAIYIDKFVVEREKEAEKIMTVKDF
jgi:hypothetical protein